jgi:hypothetical protein
MCFKPGVTRVSDYFCAVNKRGVEQTRIALRGASSKTASVCLENEAKNWYTLCRDRICPSVSSFPQGTHFDENLKLYYTLGMPLHLN